MNLHQEITPEVIKRVPPSGDYRGWLSMMVEPFAAEYDIRLFAYAQKATEGAYSGGAWTMEIWSNGAWFLDLNHSADSSFPLVNHLNYCDETTNARGLSIAVNLALQNQLIWQMHDNNDPRWEQMSRNFHALRDVARLEADSKAIFRFID